jgi:hypothetical protein
MKLYIKRLGNAVPVSVAEKPDGPYHVIGGAYLAMIATPAQIYEANKLMDDTRKNPVVEIEVPEEMWTRVKSANNL